MWCLSSMADQNKRAASAAHKKEIRKALRNKKAVCDSESDQCSGDVTSREYFDIFGSYAKGVVHTCSHCEELYGSPPSGYFECACCSKWFVENYTHELYFAHDENGDTVCLNCFRDRYLSKPDNFLSLDDDSIERFSFEDVKKAPHLLAVQQSKPPNLKCHASVLFDSGSGETVTSSCSTSPQINGVNELKDALRQMKAEGEEKAVLIMDQAWQFCCQVSLYSLNREQLRKAA